MCLGRLALFGLATQSELARAHGISESTVSRARQRLEQRGESGFVGPRKERRRHGIEDPELLARAARMLEAGRRVYGVATELGVSSSTLWRYTRESRLPASPCPARLSRSRRLSRSLPAPSRSRPQCRARKCATGGTPRLPWAVRRATPRAAWPPA